MGIDEFSETIGEDFLSGAARAKYRDRFRKELAFGIERMKIHVFGKLNAGCNTDCIFVWKVPGEFPLHIDFVNYHYHMISLFAFSYSRRPTHR